MNTYKDRLERLEQALRLWEDLCFMRRMEHLLAKKTFQKLSYPLAGPLLNADSFRNYLLTSFGEIFDNAKYNGPDTLWEEALGLTWLLPNNLHAWVNCSRKAYHLSSEMQAMLGATSLEGVTWNDLRWPFHSFAVTLENPITDNNGHDYDCFLVTRGTQIGKDKHYPMVFFHAFGTDLDHYIPLQKEDRPLIKRAIERGDRKSRPIKRFQRWLETKDKLEMGFDSLLFMEDLDMEIVEHFRQLDRWRIDNPSVSDAREMALRLAFGICMLLQTKEADKYVYSKEKVKPRRTTGNRSAVTDESELFLISCEHIMERRTKEIVKSIGETQSIKKLRPHFRTGHWRRPRGRGNDPTCPKTIWVRPAEVNKELLPKNGVPLATKTVVAE